MRFIKWGSMTAMAGLTGCVLMPGSIPTPPARPHTTPQTLQTSPSSRPDQGLSLKPQTQAQPSESHTPPRNWDEYRRNAAQRIVQTNAGESFSGPLPQRLQSIPVLQVQLHRDGSVRRIEVLRTPKFAPQTVKLAIAAVQQAAPFGSVAHLPAPWQFNETFLYNDDLKFQLRSLAIAD